jgi:hypothetical protein
MTDNSLKQMDELESRLDQQDKILNEILLCLKGNASMNIEGVLPAQKRIEEKLFHEIKVLSEWQMEIQKYFDVISSKWFLRLVFYFFMLVILIFVYVQLGGHTLIIFIKKLFE